LSFPQFCPHFCEHVWRTLLHKDGSVLVAGWPAASPPDITLQRANAYLQDVIVDLRKLLAKQIAPPKKAPKKGAEPPPPIVKPTVGTVFIAEKFGGWQVRLFRGMAGSLEDFVAMCFGPDPESSQ
jgi:leucyl-tRNA synthetase